MLPADRYVQRTGRASSERSTLGTLGWMVPESRGHVRCNRSVQLFFVDPGPPTVGFIASCGHCQPCGNSPQHPTTAAVGSMTLILTFVTAAIRSHEASHSVIEYQGRNQPIRRTNIPGRRSERQSRTSTPGGWQAPSVHPGLVDARWTTMFMKPTVTGPLRAVPDRVAADRL